MRFRFRLMGNEGSIANRPTEVSSQADAVEVLVHRARYMGEAEMHVLSAGGVHSKGAGQVVEVKMLIYADTSFDVQFRPWWHDIWRRVTGKHGRHHRSAARKVIRSACRLFTD